MFSYQGKWRNSPQTGTNLNVLTRTVVCVKILLLVIVSHIMISIHIIETRNIGKSRSTPQHTSTTYICCGRHTHMLWAHVTHNIPSPTTYVMSRCCPQHMPTTYRRYPQYIGTHKIYVHNIHPQDKTLHPQHMAVMDTRTTYQMLSTTYLEKNLMLSTMSLARPIYVVDNMLYLVDNITYMLWTTPKGYIVDDTLWTTSKVYVVEHPQHM